MEKKNINYINSINHDNYCKKEITLFINNISNVIKNFFISISQILDNLQNVSSTLNKQIVSSNYLIKEIKIEEQYSTKFHQLYDRIGMLEDSRKLFKENLKLINSYLNYFSKEIKSSFLKLEEHQKNYKVNIDEINNNFNFEYQTTLNSYNSSRNNSNSHSNNIWVNNNKNPIKDGFHTIGCSNEINTNLYNQNNIKNKHSNVKHFVMNSDLSKKPINIKSNKFTNQRNKLKIKTDNEFDLALINKRMNLTNKSNNNSIPSRIRSDSAKSINPIISFNNNDIYLNPSKLSKNFSKNRLIKRTYSLSNFISNNDINNLNINNKKNRANTNSFKTRNIINNTIINNKNELKTNPINNMNFNSIINHERENNKNKEYSFFLSNKVIQFLNTIKEMKTKYNNRNCQNKIDFKETKLKYEKLKKLILDISNKIILNYTNNIESKNENNYNNINKYKTINNFDKNNYIQQLLDKNRKFEEQLHFYDNNIKNLKNQLYLKQKENEKLILIKEELLKEKYQNNRIYSKISKDLNNNNEQNIIKINSMNEIKRDNIEEYKRKINEFKINLESQKRDIYNKDKIIENLNKKLKNYLSYDNKIKNRNTTNKNIKLFIDKAINFSYIKDLKELSNISKTILDEKEEIINELKQEIESLNNKLKENMEENNNNNHINNNIYIIKELKEKIKQITEENTNYKNKINSLLDNNKILNQKIDTLTNDINKNELLKQDQENELKKLQLIIDELNLKIKENNENIDNNSKNNNESKGKEEQIEFLLTENKELKNEIEELKEKEKEKENNISIKEDENINYKKLIDDYENKIKFLEEQNNFYKNELNNLKTENYIIQNEFKTVKEENNILNKKIKEYEIKNDEEENLRENYGIVCVKNIGNLSWILLRKKDGDEDDYDDYIWIEKNIIGNMNKFNYIY